MLGWLRLAAAFVVPPVEPPRPSALEVVWTAPEQCPDEAALRERVLALVGLDPEGEDALLVEGAVEKVEGGFRLKLRTSWGDLQDERALVDPDCGALVDATALFVAVSVGPGAVDEQPREVVDEVLPARQPSEPEPESPSGPQVPPRGPSPTAVAPTTQPRRVSEVSPGGRLNAAFARVGPQLEFGGLPGVSGGPRVSLGLQWARATVAVFGFYDAPRQTRVRDGGSGVVQLGVAGARGCFAFARSQARFDVCGLAEAGGVSAASRGLRPPKRLTFPWAAVGAHVNAEYRFGRFGLFTAAEAVAPLLRPETLVGETSVFKASAFSARWVVGLAVFFPTVSE